MTKQLKHVLLLALVAAGVHALGPAPVGAANTAAVARVGDDIKYLASDELEGRGPGTDGLQKAAEFIRDEFKELGLKSGVEDGSYMQPFKIGLEGKLLREETVLVLTSPEGEETELKLGEDYQPLAIGGSGKVEGDLVFAGYGISAPDFKYDDYQDADLEGKVVVVIRREPQQGDEESVFNGKAGTPHSYIRTKLDKAKNSKVAAILMVNDPFSTKKNKDEDPLTAPSGFGSNAAVKIPFAHVSQKVVNRLLKVTPVKAGDESIGTLEAVEKKLDETLKPLTQAMEGWKVRISTKFEVPKVEVANVIGVLEGEGPLADETIVIGAHYDHLGFGPFGSRRPKERAVHNGADDNATGTAAVLELARRMATREKKPARRLVFIGFTAEERGILGSNYYLSNPVVPLEDTVAMVNFDMIGGLKPEGLLLAGVRSAKEFGPLVEKAIADGDLKVNTSGTLGGSDHSGFYRKKIPYFFMFTGLTPLYHTPEDDFETINVEGVVQTIDFAERLVDGIIALPKRPEYVAGAGRAARRPGLAYLGVVPDYSGGSDVDGLKINDVSEDSPAAKGGLEKNDIITKIGDVPVGDIQGLTDGLRKFKPGNKVKIVVKRGDEEKTLEVTLGRPPRGR